MPQPTEKIRLNISGDMAEYSTFEDAVLDAPEREPNKWAVTFVVAAGVLTAFLSVSVAVWWLW